MHLSSTWSRIPDFQSGEAGSNPVRCTISECRKVGIRLVWGQETASSILATPTNFILPLRLFGRTLDFGSRKLGSNPGGASKNNKVKEGLKMDIALF